MKKIVAVLTILLFAAGFSLAQGKFGASVQGGVALPMGDFGDVYSTGFGGMGTLLYSVSPNVDLSASVGYTTWSGKDAFDGWSFSSVPVLGGARYYFGGGNVSFYTCAELGIHFGSSEVEVFNPFTNTTTTVSGSDSNFGFGVGAGVLIPVGKSANVDITAKYNSISSSGSSTSFIGIYGGVQFGFN